jgi:hypothetical protein
MPSYLLIANQTADGPELRRWARNAVARSRTRCRFHLVVPATRVERRFTWTAGESRAAARRHLEQGMANLADLGAVVTGEVGDESPLLAAGDALREHAVDTVVVSTLPVGRSRWLRADLVSRLRRYATVPVVPVACPAELVGSAA